MNNRGQFSVIAALLVAIVLIGTLIAVYAMIRYDSTQSQPPQSLTATDETNLAILKALGFTVGYYGSMLQVTGNQTYAETNATAYMNNALQYIESMNPSWGESISMTSLNLKTDWFSNPSISEGQLSVVYDLTNLGIYGINYTTSCSLAVQIFKSPNSHQVCLNVTQDSTEPLTNLGLQNFAFYSYNYSASNWQLVNPSLNPIIFTNGTYLINPPSGTDDSAFMVQVTDSRGIMVEASSFDSYNLGFAFGQQSIMQNTPVVVQLLQNGTMQTFGQDLVNTTQILPIPPIPVKSINLCQTGSTSEIPFQVEDWASQYRIPLGLTSNCTIFSNSQMIVFEVTPSTSQLTLWWNGSDTATQPSSAYRDTSFTGDNPNAGTLSNGKMTLQFSYPNSIFTVTSTVGGVSGASSTTTFMRINNDHSIYGSGSPAYVIQYGVVRDIVQEEAEWSNGPTDCQNTYSQIVLTFPANTNYFTYQLRLIFISSSVARNIDDISPLQLKTPVTGLQAITENGISNGIPNVSYGSGTFSNSTDSAHHWSELINSGQQGTGIMFTDSANKQLYVFDSMTHPHAYTGALYVNTATPVIELDPVTSAGNVSFTSALDLTWYGAVATFNGANPIYTSNGNSGLWSLVEQPPTVSVTPESLSATSISISPSIDPVGTTVTVSGIGFLPNSQITITYDGNTVKTTTATNYGAIPSGTAFRVPTSPLGSNTVKAYDTASDSASTNFNVTLYTMETITLETSGVSNDAGPATILTIDSVSYNCSALPISFIWQVGSTHTISASSPVSVGSTKQYLWQSWSDGGAQTHNYVVPSSSATVTANYYTQYQVTFSQTGVSSSAGSNTVLTVGSTNYAYNTLPSSVWVNSSTSFSWAATVSGGTGIQFILSGSSGSSPIFASGTYSATYTTQYYLTVSSSYGSPAGQNWYNAGSSATFSVTTPASGGTGTQYVFSSWSGSGGGSYSGPSSSQSVTMNNAITETASWQTQYQVTFSQTGIGSGAGSNTVLTVGTTNYAYNTLPSKTWFNSGTTFSWASTVSGSTGTQYAESSSSGTSPITATGTYSATYTTQYYLTVTSSYGSPTGQNWYNAGSSATFSVTTPVSGGTGIQYAFSSWSGSGGGSYSGPSSSHSVTMNNAITETASWQTQYQVTFTQSGITNAAGSNTVLTVGTTNYAYNALPTNAWFNSGTTFTWASPVSGGSGTQFVESGSSGTSPITASGTNSATYTTQYKVTFTQSGINSAAGTNTVLTVGSTNYAYNGLPNSVWFNSGTTFTWASTVSGGTGVQFVLSSSTGTSPISGSGTYSATYTTQYQVTFDASSNVKGDSSATIVTVAGTAYTGAQLPYTNWFNAGSLTYSYASPIGSSSSSTTGYYWSSTAGLGQTLQSNTFTLSGSGTITGTYTAQSFGIASNCEGFGSVTNAKTITTTSMTAQANELIVIVITGNSNNPTVSSVTDNFGTHLTYHSEVSYTSASAGQCLYVYYAVTGSQTGSFTITVKMSSNYNYCVQAFGVTGANTATPFDTNGGTLPAKNVGSSSVPTITGVSTSNANDMLLAFEGQTSSTAQTAGSSFIAPSGLLHNANSLGNNAEYELVTSKQTNVNVSFGTSVSSWIMAVAAVQRAW